MTQVPSDPKTGRRAFVRTGVAATATALAAPFIASAFAWVARHRRTVPFVAAATTAVVLLSVAQMYQYWIGVMPQADTTWAQYRDLFLRFR